MAAALQQLADVEEKVEKVHEQQAKDDFYLLSELIHDYIGIVSAVKDAFNERVKAWQSWQAVQVRRIMLPMRRVTVLEGKVWEM